MNGRSKKKKAGADGSFLLRLTGRFTLFLALFTAVLFAFYVSGNYQRFLDGTQRFLLLACCITSILLVLLSITGLAQCLILFLFTRRLRYLAPAALFLSVLIIVPVLFAVSRLLTFLSGGL